MVLSRGTLQRGLTDLPRNVVPPPRGIRPAAIEFAKVLEDYFKDGQAGDTVVVLSFTTLVPILVDTMIRQRFLHELGTSIQRWALTWAWASPNFTGAPGTTRAQGALLNVELQALILQALVDKSVPVRDNTSELAKRIHNWAKRGNIVVTLTNNSSGATSPNPVF
jgi:hypothetical protein